MTLVEARRRLQDGLPLVWVAGAVVFALLYPLLRLGLDGTGALLGAGFEALAGSVALARFATADRSPRQAALEGVAFAAAVVAIYWLVFVWPLPEPWW